MIQNGRILDGLYQIEREIGQGGTGIIYLARHLRLNKYVVVKKIKDHFNGKINERIEVDILKNLHHRSLPQVYDFLVISSSVYTVMDYIPGKDLQYYLDRRYTFSEDRLRGWLLELADVLQYLHTQVHPILHSDIKPGNIMITETGHVCLIDFNISLDGENSRDIHGISPWYAAPEQYRKAQARRNHLADSVVLDGRMDIYSLGATFFHLMTGIRPEPVRDLSLTMESMELPYTPGFRQVIARMIRLDPSARYSSAEKLKKALEDISKYDPVYRRSGYLQIAAAFGWALCMIAGLLCLYYGSWRNTVDGWSQEYQKIYVASQSDEYLTVIADGTEVLNSTRFRSYLNKKPAQKAELLNFIGEACYQQGQYGDAVRYYKEAWELNSRKSGYFENYLISLIRDGQYETAQQEADSSYGIRMLTVDKRNLIQLEIAWESGETGSNVTELAQLAGQLAQSGSGEMAANAYIILGDTLIDQEEYASAVSILEKAVELVSDRNVRRLLAEAAAKASEDSSKSNVRYTYLQKAADQYRILASGDTASYEDRLNYALTIRAMGSYEESNWTLKELVSAYPDQYQPSMWLCYNYLDILNKNGNASSVSTDLSYYYQSCRHLYEEWGGEDDNMIILENTMRELGYN
ncbi:MAG: protein kinase [Lachnospiraceae bacterium]|nr:protein kinase [Lachnospiraceae bacterium]